MYRDRLLFAKGGSFVIAQINCLCLCCVDQVMLASRGVCIIISMGMGEVLAIYIET